MRGDGLKGHGHGTKPFPPGHGTEQLSRGRGAGPLPRGRGAGRLPRGQGAMEFLVVAALLTMIAAAMVVPAVRETEASMALSAARTGAFNAALGEKVELTSMDFSQTDGGYQITPRVLVDGKPVAPSDGMRKAMMESMAAALSPSAGADGSNCVSGVFAKYCISG